MTDVVAVGHVLLDIRLLVNESVSLEERIILKESRGIGDSAANVINRC